MSSPFFKSRVLQFSNERYSITQGELKAVKGDLNLQQKRNSEDLQGNTCELLSGRIRNIDKLILSLVMTKLYSIVQGRQTTACGPDPSHNDVSLAQCCNGEALPFCSTTSHHCTQSLSNTYRQLLSYQTPFPPPEIGLQSFLG